MTFFDSSRSSRHRYGLLAKVSLSELKCIRICVRRKDITSSQPPGELKRDIDDPASVVSLVHSRKDNKLPRLKSIFDREDIAVNEVETRSKTRSRSLNRETEECQRSIDRGNSRASTDRTSHKSRDQQSTERNNYARRSRERSRSLRKRSTDRRSVDRSRSPRHRSTGRRSSDSRRSPRCRSAGREPSARRKSTDRCSSRRKSRDRTLDRTTRRSSDRDSSGDRTYRNSERHCRLRESNHQKPYSGEYAYKKSPDRSSRYMRTGRDRSYSGERTRNRSRERNRSPREKNRSRSRERNRSQSRERNRSRSRERNRSRSRERNRSESRRNRSLSRGTRRNTHRSSSREGYWDRKREKSIPPLKPGEYIPNHPDLKKRLRDRDEFARKSSFTQRSPERRRTSLSPKRRRREEERSRRSRSRSVTQSRRSSRSPGHTEKRNSRRPSESSRPSEISSPRGSREYDRSRNKNVASFIDPRIDYGYYESVPGSEYWLHPGLIRPGYPMPQFYPPSFYPRGMPPGGPVMFPPRYPFVPPMIRPRLPIYNSRQKPRISEIDNENNTNSANNTSGKTDDESGNMIQVSECSELHDDSNKVGELEKSDETSAKD